MSKRKSTSVDRLRDMLEYAEHDQEMLKRNNENLEKTNKILEDQVDHLMRHAILLGRVIKYFLDEVKR